jgi:hypothetical protein
MVLIGITMILRNYFLFSSPAELPTRKDFLIAGFLKPICGKRFLIAFVSGMI